MEKSRSSARVRHEDGARRGAVVLVLALVASLLATPSPSLGSEAGQVDAAASSTALDREPHDRLACPQRLVPADVFTDVRSGAHKAAIECFVWWGVTSGTQPGRYGPSGEVNRAQMASFLARTLDAAGIAVPTAGPQFSDVEGNPHADAINALAALGVVSGADGDRYAPHARVTRAQMATMIVGMHEKVVGGHLDPGGSAFTDIAGNPHATSIRKLVAMGVTQGTSATTYGPGEPVTRAQMATFLTRYLSHLAHRGQAPGRPRTHAKDPSALPDAPNHAYVTYGTIGPDEVARTRLAVNVAYHEIGSPGPFATHLFSTDTRGTDEGERLIDAFINSISNDPEHEIDDPNARANVERMLYSGCGVAGLSAMFVRFDECDWYVEHAEKNIYHTIIHEYAHSVHIYLHGYRRDWPDSSFGPIGPVWLEEGAAEYAAYELTAEYGWLDHHKGRQRIREWAARTSATLQSMESGEGMHAPGVDEGYAQAALAGELLGHLGGRLSVFSDYYARVGTGMDWRQAFEESFGLPVERFYEVFAAYKAAGLERTLPRATTDRPSDRSGPKVKFLYTVAADGPDHRRDVDGSVGAIALGLQRWIAEQSDGQHLALDTYRAIPDVAFLRHSKTLDELHDLAGSAPVAMLEDLRAAGFDDPDTIYVAIYEGSHHGQCMGGMTADRGLITLAMAKGPDGHGCSPEDFSFAYVPQRNDSFIYTVMSKLLEALHFAKDCYEPWPPDGRIPDYESPLHDVRSVGPYDADQPIALDPLRSRYWGHGRDDCQDLSRSQFVSQPVGR